MKVICYGNCNLTATYSILEGHPEISDLDFMINFNYPLPNPMQIFSHHPTQINKFKECDVLIVQITTDSYGSLSMKYIIDNYIKPETKVIYVPWYKVTWLKANNPTSATEELNNTFLYLEKLDNLADTLAKQRNNSYAIKMASIYKSKYQQLRFHHDETHPTYHFIFEFCKQICDYLNISLPITTIKCRYTNPKSYFYDCYPKNLHSNILDITRQTLNLTFPIDSVPPSWPDLLNN